MTFAAKSKDLWRQPIEVREAILAALQQRGAAVGLETISPIELARRCGINPDVWQRDLLLSIDRQIILNCSRQSGKSTVCACIATHTAIFKPDSLILVLAPSQRQAMELHRKILDFYGSLTGVPEPIAESSLKLELANGSRVQVLPAREANIRGFSGVDLLIEDEAARVPDELYYAVRPMLAVSGGRLILLSTPFGSRGHFWKEWTEGEDWKRVKITAADCPRIDRGWLSKERERIGDWWYSQEYLCEFVDSVTQIFATDDITRAISYEVRPLWN